MKLSIGIEYAIHCLLYMVNIEDGKSVGIKELATFQGVSESYLSKVYTKLSKAGIVKSVPGAKGGYELARSADDISFWDIVEAVEGKESFFQCAEIRQNATLLHEDNEPEPRTKCPCLIKVVMDEAEQEMRNYLSKKTLAWLHHEVYHKILTPRAVDIANSWFDEKAK